MVDHELVADANEPEPGDDVDARPSAEPYVHDPAHVADAVALFDAAHAAGDEWSAASAISAGAAAHGWTLDDPVVRALELSALFRLRVPHGQNPGVGCTLGPQHDATTPYPARINDVPDPVVALWRDLAGGCAVPAARARAHDLLFERRDGDIGMHAREAIDAYLELVRSTSLSLLSAAALLRAWELSRRVAAWERHAVVQALLLRSAQTGLATDQPQPGVVLPLLRAAVEPPRRKQPPAAMAVSPDTPTAEELLEQATVRYPQDYLVREVFGLLRRRATDPAALVALARREVQAHLDEAATGPNGFVRQHRLIGAIDVARDRGLPDMVDQATRQLQSIPVASLKLTSVSTSVNLPAFAVEQYLAPFTRGVTWREPLAYFLLIGPPTGSYAWLEQQQRDLAQGSVLGRLFGTTRLMERSLPKETVSPDTGQARQIEIAQIATRVGALHGDLLATGLRRLAHEFGTPAADDVAAFLGELGAADPVLCLRFAEALVLFWEQRHDACLHVIVPRIETAARSLLRECDVATFRTQVGASPGGYVGLQPLLAALRDNHLDDDWGFFLRWLLLDPGLNLRNEVAHGLLASAAPGTAALGLRAAGLLILLAGRPADLGWDAACDGHQADVPPVGPPLPRRAQLHARLAEPVPGQIALPMRGVLVAAVAGSAAQALRKVASVVTRLADRVAL